MSADLHALRRSYERAELRRSDLFSQPLEQFEHVLQQAMQHPQIAEAYAFSLATTDAEGWPSVRTLLLRHLDEGGLRFFTHANSEKGKAIAATGRAEALFFWEALEMQVRVRGIVEQISEESTNEYWRSRPRESQLAARVSRPQSGEVISREALQRDYLHQKEIHEGKDVPRPEHWHGYVLRPHRWEFWQGRPGRLHDRFVYLRQDDEASSWRIARLMP